MSAYEHAMQVMHKELALAKLQAMQNAAQLQNQDLTNAATGIIPSLWPAQMNPALGAPYGQQRGPRFQRNGRPLIEDLE